MNDGSLLGIPMILGPIILLIALVWVINNNRNKRVSKAETDRATDANYKAEDAASKAKDAAD